MDLASMIISAANSLVAVLWGLLWSLSALAGMVYAGTVLRRMQLATIEPGHRPITLGSTFAVLVIGAALFSANHEHCECAVSYTHLTLPTKRIV